jgi:hypothetical protein
MQIVDMLIFPYRDSAAKKAKFFFHPDKLPKDLTENQTKLMKVLWDELCDKESSLLLAAFN